MLNVAKTSLKELFQKTIIDVKLIKTDKVSYSSEFGNWGLPLKNNSTATNKIRLMRMLKEPYILT